METTLLPDAEVQALRGRLPTRERRMYPGTIALRRAGDGVRIGMFTPFNRESLDLGGFVEVVAPSAFTKSLQERRSDVVALWNHDPMWVLGRESNRTMTITVTDEGVDSEVSLDGDDPMHKHFARRVERRDVVGSSFGFETVRDRWEKLEDGSVLRTLLEVKLYDISPVTFPAYPEAEAETRSLAVFDVAAVRSGLDVREMAEALGRVEGGRVAATDVEAVRAFVARLSALCPEPVASVAARERELRHRARRMGLAA